MNTHTNPMTNEYTHTLSLSLNQRLKTVFFKLISCITLPNNKQKQKNQIKADNNVQYPVLLINFQVSTKQNQVAESLAEEGNR